ncbi:GAF domain-containing sensor histidine kinase [Actinoplanes sp. Pm04-4]|uniref:Sensor-like histidine kinase SenX3 n=1 Tax=Paractinoplanes pyxinae TaxID=2997416 RepID=A0ABT4BGW8_9ACTN|nr:GAF domain-containing sensor histidine kinase [Actinoplanes pyxinae]MCY1145696.1 GAF domain-containing sensor histidine kinase [Actinoplanes pyxinae]
MHRYQLFDQPRRRILDDLAHLASSMFDLPIAAVSLVDEQRVWFAGAVGLTSDDAPAARSICARIVATGRALIISDIRAQPWLEAFSDPVGESSIRSYAGAPIVDEDGHVVGVLSVAGHQARQFDDRERDLLERLAGQAAGHLAAIRSRLALTEVGEELSRLVRREEDLVATVSHELRTPVTSMLGYLELLVDEDSSGAYQPFLEPMRRNGARLVRMVDDLLAGAVPVGAAMDLGCEPVDLAAVAETAAVLCVNHLNGRPADISIETVGEQATVQGDFTRLCQATEHLLRNAVLYSPATSPILVRVTTSERPCIEVVDYGRGIPADELPHVTQRFYRGQQARRNAVPGMGLGLAIARGIVEAHGGSLTLTCSPEADGTTACLRLPARRPLTR